MLSRAIMVERFRPPPLPSPSPPAPRRLFSPLMLEAFVHVLLEESKKKSETNYVVKASTTCSRHDSLRYCYSNAQVREMLTAKDSWGRTLVSHGILSTSPQVFEVCMAALRADVLDEEVRIVCHVHDLLARYLLLLHQFFPANKLQHVIKLRARWR